MAFEKKTHIFRLGASALLLFACVAGARGQGANGASATQAKQGTEAAREQSEAVESAQTRVSRALVRIHVVEARYDDGRSLKNEASGSGAIISPDGYIVTNHHVAGDAVRLFVTMPTREEIPAELIGTDPMADIAVIRLQPDKPRKFEYAEFGDSDKLQVGDTVLAMGSPLSLSQSVTRGIVSNTEMIMPAMFAGSAFELDGENVGSIVRWIGHDAAIFPGNSGGPLVNLQGKIIGINEISMGLSGAIPGNLAREIANKLITNEKHEVERAFLGLMLQPVFKHDRDIKGAVVSDVVEGSPASKAGVKTGDLLKMVGAHAVDVHFAEEMPPLNLYIAELPIGKPVELTLERDGKTLVKSLTPQKRERAQPRQREYKQWAMTGRNLSIWTAIEMKRKDKNGVLVTSVGGGGPAGQAKPAMQTGDIILKVNDQPVRSMSDLTSITAALTKGKDEPVSALVSFARQGEEMMTVVRIGVSDLNDPGREVRKAWIPVDTQVLTRDLIEQLNLKATGGVRVTQVYDDDTTQTGGPLKVGDIILTLDGEPIPASEPHDVEVFPSLLRQYPIGTEVTLGVLRNGKTFEMKMKLPARPPQPREMPRYQDHDFDFTVRDVAYLDRMLARWKDQPTGLLVETVEDGGWAALGRLQPGDLLMEVDGQPVSSVTQIKDVMDKLKADKKSSVIFKVRRGVYNMFLEIEPLWKTDAQ